MDALPGFPSTYELIKRVDDIGANLAQILSAIAVASVAAIFVTDSLGIQIFAGGLGLWALASALDVIPDVVLGQDESSLENYLIARQRKVAGARFSLGLLMVVVLLASMIRVFHPNVTAEIAVTAWFLISVVLVVWIARDQLGRERSADSVAWRTV